MTARLYGEAYSLPATLQRHLGLHYCTRHLELRWSHCSATANFLSGYFAGLFLPEYGAAGTKDLSHSIAYLANELLENAVKFRAAGDVELVAGLHGGEFVLAITNHISATTSADFEKLLMELTAGDPGDLLLQRIEANAEDPASSGSGLGLLTLMNDYGVRFCWTFAPGAFNDDRVRLETVARLPLPAHQT